MKKLTTLERIRNLRRSYDEMQKRSEERQRKQGTTPTYDSEVIGLLKTDSGEQHTIRKFFAEVKIPADFSLITNPKESLQTICKLANTVRSGRRIKNYKFDHSNMEAVDISAECILDFVAAEIRRESRSKKLKFSGIYPKEKSLKRLLRGIGIIRHLEIEHEYLDPVQMNEIEVFEGRARKSDTLESGALSDAELEAKNLVDHINKCLKKTGHVLTQQAVLQLSTYAGEVMGNADEHSGKRKWFIKGYYDHDCIPNYCGVAIVNFGNTIAQTFSEIEEESYAYKEIAPYLETHSKKGAFSSKWSIEDLLTLIALQGGISSKNYEKTDTRGMGTVEMIGFFDAMAKECSTVAKPEMAILSGSTHIRFDGKYRLPSDKSERKIIAFNDTNDLNLPPDPEYVTSIKPLYFPGSVISIRFPLPPTSCEQIKANR